MVEETLSVVLPVLIYNPYLERLTRDCIQELRFWTYPVKLQIILVHNQSQLCPSITSELNKDDIYLPQPNQNLRVGKGLNIGISKASSENILILANDVFVHKGWFPPLKKAIDDKVLDMAMPWMWRFRDDYQKELDKGTTILPFPFSSGGGNCCLFKKETYDYLGPLDENLIIFCDRDYNYRIGFIPQKKLIKTGMVLNSTVTHLGSMTWLMATQKEQEFFQWPDDFDDNKYLTEKWKFHK